MNLTLDDSNLTSSLEELSGFQIIGTKIYDPDGQEFIIKGANMFTWEGTENVDSYLNDWGFNTIRVPNYLLGSYNQPHPAEDDYATNKAIVDAYTSQGAVVIFDAHDRIGGYYEGDDWSILKDYWRDMAREFKDNPNVWFNLHNEPGNATANGSQWVEYHRELIDIIRAEGANNLIVVDGEAWGQDYHTETIANNALDIMEGNENIIFSVHVYDQWIDQDIGAYFDTLHALDIPVIVGEYGSENIDQSTIEATQQMLTAAQEREIGRIVWGTKADDNNDLTTGTGGHAEHFDGTNPEILTELGELVWNDLQRTEELEQLEGYDDPNNSSTFTTGTFQADDSGQIQFDFLFDGGWFQGELAIFNLEGMEAYTPGSQEFIQEAALRGISNSPQGQLLLSDPTEGALFSSFFAWERDFNTGDYLGTKTFNLNPGDDYGIMVVQHTTIEEIANNPGNMWQWGKLPLFSIPEANPGGVADGQMVAVDDNGTFAFEDVRVDWGESDGDYNDLVFQILGASGEATSMDAIVNPERDWRNTAIGQDLLDYASDAVNGENFAINNSSTSNFNTESLSTDSSASSSTISEFRIDNTLDAAKFTSDSDSLTNSTIDGGDGSDKIKGTNQSEIIYGNGGNDQILGGDNNDILIGGQGDDTLRGGNGSDLFVLSSDGGIDVIEDFAINQDLIQLSGKLKFADLAIVQSIERKGDLSAHIYLAENNELLAVVKNIDASELTILDFI